MGQQEEENIAVAICWSGRGNKTLTSIGYTSVLTPVSIVSHLRPPSPFPRLLLYVRRHRIQMTPKNIGFGLAVCQSVLVSFVIRDMNNATITPIPLKPS